MTSLARWRMLLPKVRRCLRAYPNVTGVGLGLRESSDPSRGPVWRVYVTSKLPECELSSDAIVPATLLGLATDVIATHVGRPTANAPKVYTAGVEIESNGPGVPDRAEGALGCFARDQANRPVLLTCSHVMFPGFVALPQVGIYQPDYSSCCSGGDEIATPVFDPKEVVNGQFKGGFKTKLGEVQIPAPNEKGYKTSLNQLCSETDCAIARLKPGVMFENVLRTPGEDILIKGANPNVLSIPFFKAGTTPPKESYVRVFTPRQGGGKLIFATLLWTKTSEIPDSIAVDENTPNEYRHTPLFHRGISEDAKRDLMAGTLPSINQFLILPRARPIPGENDYNKFYGQPNQTLTFEHGDSGSIVIDHDGFVIGQVVRMLKFNPQQFLEKPAERNLIEFTSVGSIGVASPIRDVLAQLNITIPENGFSGTAPSEGTATLVFVSGFSENPEIAARRRGAERLREGLRACRRGKLLLGKIAQHRREVRHLLTTVRAISAAWRDLNAPGFYSHCVQSALDPDHVIPMSINDIPRERLLDVLLPLFARHGSPGLRRDIERYRLWAAGALLQITTIDDVPEVVARRWRPA